MAFIALELTDRQFNTLLAAYKETAAQERQGYMAIIARLDALHAKFDYLRADADLANAAREAKAIIDETADALNAFTPNNL